MAKAGMTIEEFQTGLRLRGFHQRAVRLAHFLGVYHRHRGDVHDIVDFGAALEHVDGLGEAGEQRADQFGATDAL